jgi:hypothetical protein
MLVFPKFRENQKNMHYEREPESELPDPATCKLVDAGSTPEDCRKVSGEHPVEVKLREDKLREEASTPSAPKRSTASAQKPVTYDFTTGLFSGVTDEMVATWQAACPAVSVEREIVKAAQWLLANPKKRKQNYRRFLLNWIMRAQERGKG